MKNRNSMVLSGLASVMGAALIVGCGGGPSTHPYSSPQDGSVVAFGTDAPVCDVESFVATITSASLVPPSGGTPVALITATAPATVDFARLVDFTNILSTASVAPGTYSQLQMTLSNPQLIAINTSTSPPSPQSIPVTLTATTFTLTINPSLVVTSSTTSGLLVDFNLLQSVQVNGAGQPTGMVDPQFTITAPATSGTTVGEADSLYGIVQTPSISNLPSGFTGSFPLVLGDGTGQTLTILVNSSTVFEGDGVTGFSDLSANTFVEVDAIVNTSGQIIAQTIDSEEQTSSASQKSAFLGKVIAVTRDVSGNATSLTLLIDTEIPDQSATVPLHSGLTVDLTGTTHYFTNWQHWNRQGFAFNPQSLGVAEKVAVFGVLGSGSPPTLTANQVFLRPRNVLGNYNNLLTAGSDGVTGAFTMTPCGGLFGGQPITVLTYSDSVFTGLTGLTALTSAPTLDTNGLLFHLQTDGTTSSGVSWLAPTWIMQARGVHQLPAN